MQQAPWLHLNDLWCFASIYLSILHIIRTHTQTHTNTKAEVLACDVYISKSDLKQLGSFPRNHIIQHTNKHKAHLALMSTGTVLIDI